MKEEKSIEINYVKEVEAIFGLILILFSSSRRVNKQFN